MKKKAIAWIIILSAVAIQNLYRRWHEEAVRLQCLHTPPIYDIDVEQYMTDHQFSKKDKKKVRDFLNQNQAVGASLDNTYLYYLRGGGEYLVPYSVLGIRYYD